MIDHELFTYENHLSLLYSSRRYQIYARDIDKALYSFECFEKSIGWANYIVSLTKLSRVLQKRSKNFPILPKSEVIARRLSECLYYTLPVGVHLKALEVYKQFFIILQRRGSVIQSGDLYYYVMGILPLLDYCSERVKTELLIVFEKYILPLCDNLKPSTLMVEPSFSSSARNQQFSIPKHIVYYMIKSDSNLKVYKKLIQTCKYFFITNPIEIEKLIRLIIIHLEIL